ncbi:CHAD domain-containing protein [Streptomyces sp. enrichment culture]|uniref:CHAD domain-containing protein n=1 Tax=Streptomyces sp. enrichment culture TaxID=1795815 RepID=UPI003F5704A1
MAPQHPDPTHPAAGPVPAAALERHLRAQATAFLRALRLHRETGTGAAPEESAEAARALRRSARRISAGLHTFQPLLDRDWAQALSPELAWVSGTLAVEHGCTARLQRLLAALHRLSGAPVLPTQAAPAPGTPPARAASRPPAAHGSPAAPPPGRPGTGAPAPARSRTTTATTAVPPPSPATTATAPAPGTALSLPDRGNLTVGAVKAGALLDRQLTLARTRAHSTALQALRSSRFHAVADQVAVLASEVPLAPAADRADLRAPAAAARDRLADAVAALPLVTAGSPYNAEALIHGLSPDPAPHPQDAPWHQVRLLLRLHRYAREVLRDGEAGGGEAPPTPADAALLAAGTALDRHRDAAEAATAAAQAARTPRIAPATAYALGVLHADQRHEVEAARYAFQRCWRKDVLGAP